LHYYNYYFADSRPVFGTTQKVGIKVGEKVENVRYSTGKGMAFGNIDNLSVVCSITHHNEYITIVLYQMTHIYTSSVSRYWTDIC
jgi:hypothetical protein